MAEIGYKIGLPLVIKIPTTVIEKFDHLANPVTLVIEVPVIREHNSDGSDRKVLAVLFGDIKAGLKVDAGLQDPAHVLRYEQCVITRIEDDRLDDTADTQPMSPDMFLTNGGTPQQSPPTSPSIL